MAEIALNKSPGRPMNELKELFVSVLTIVCIASLDKSFTVYMVATAVAVTERFI